MNGYLCALRLTGEPLHRSEIFGPLARIAGGRSERLLAAELGAFAAVARSEGEVLRPPVARLRQWAAVGDVRLDDRKAVAAVAGIAAENASDLELVLAALDARGDAAVDALSGDFAFAAWDARGQKLIAARDPFGVRPLFLSYRGDLLLLSSRLSAFAEEGDYDLEYIAQFLAGGRTDGERTIWRNARSLRPGSVLVQRGTVGSVRRYWRPEELVPAARGDEAELTRRFRELFREGVKARVGDADTWAQLSGGLDSSSVVATVETLRAAGELPRGLSGTVTIVDSLGDGDERPYSDEIVARFGVRNECVHDFWAWQDDGSGPPATDEPRPVFPFFERDRRLADIVRSAGGRVLLSGFGSDHLLCGNLGYIADLAAHGRVGAAMGEAARWALAHRQSFWTTARHTVLLPLLPGRGPAPVPGALAPWLADSFARAHMPGGGVRARPGRLFQAQVVSDLAHLPFWMDREPFNDELEMRYPFLHRPLVEFALALPVSMRIRPEGRKWILREAMRDVLPERIRTRGGKGGMDARILWSLARERARIDSLLRDPLLAELGCVEPARLRHAVREAEAGVVTNLVTLMLALSLETWLAVQAGRWTAAESVRTAA